MTDVRRAVFGVLVALVLISPLLDGQSGAPPAIPRLGDGKPDLSGVYYQPGRRNIADGLGPLPFTPAGKAEFEGRMNVVDPEVRCIFPGVPRIAAHEGPMKIVQIPGKLVLLYEWMHNFRTIPTDAKAKHVEEAPPQYLGDAIGRWDGDTLVIETIGFNDETWLDDFGHQHSEALKVTERLTRTAYDQLQYEFTIDDPMLYTKPWGSKWTLRLMPAGTELREEGCRENAYGPGKDPTGPGKDPTRATTRVAPKRFRSDACERM